MSKKYLRKNEFRMDNNPAHFGEERKPHPAYITARYKHMYKANGVTHSQYTTDGYKTIDIDENPNKNSKDKRKVRVTPPFWQNENKFSENKLLNFSFSRKTRRKISRINKKYK